MVIVYDYYDQSRRARSFYDVVPATLCDICVGDDCPDDGCPGMAFNTVVIGCTIQGDTSAW